MKNFFIVLLMIVIIAGTGYGVYYQIDNHNNKNETSSEVDKNEEKEEVGESIDVNSKDITNLLSYFNSFDSDCTNGGKNIGYFYQDNLNSENVNNDIKLVVALNYIFSNNQNFPISKDEMDNIMMKIFGNTNYDVNFNKDSYIELQGLTFNSSLNQFVYTEVPFGCSGPVPYYDKKVLSATKYNDRIEIEIEIAYIEYNTEDENGTYVNIYSNNSKSNIIKENVNTNELESMNSYNTNNKYKFIYRLNADNTYYFSEVQKID